MRCAWLERPGSGPLAPTAGTGLLTEAKVLGVCGEAGALTGPEVWLGVETRKVAERVCGAVPPEQPAWPQALALTPPLSLRLTLRGGAAEIPTSSRPAHLRGQ